MAEFLTTSGTSHHLENVIIDAERKIILVSPYLQISKTLIERLKDAGNRRIKITIIYGKDELKQNEKKALEDMKGIELYYFENLHAKCYFNERKMIITSMNMYEFSERKNREMGILIDVENDKSIYDKAVNEVNSILQSSKQVLLSKPTVAKDTKAIYNRKHNGGYCIRCSEHIPYNPSSPYCSDCYRSWSHWNNYHFEEKVCHHCGNHEDSTMAKPECYKCYITA